MELVKLGKVVKLHGYLGAIKISTTFDGDFDINKIDKIYDENQNPYTVKRIFSNTDAVVVESEEIDIEKAKTLIGKDIYILRKLVEGKILFEDLKGSNVFFEDGELLGEIVDVQDYGAAEVFYMLSVDGREIMFPNANNVIKSFSYKEKKLIVDKNRLKEVADI